MSKLPHGLSSLWPLSSVPRVILTASGMQRLMSCSALQREFERMCPRCDPRSARVVYDVTAYVNDYNLSVDGNPSPSELELEERRKAAAIHANHFAQDYGIIFMEVFDLSAPEFNSAHYAEAVSNADVYYADIGNTWALLHWLKARGNVKSANGVVERVKRGEMLYIGNSAGAICGGKSAETATWKNWDDMWGWQKHLSGHARTNWHNPKSRLALDIAGGISFFPHYDSTWIQVCEKRKLELDHEAIVCANGHGVVIVGGVSRLISPEGYAAHMPLQF